MTEEGQSNSGQSALKIENLFFLNGITSLLGWNVVLSSLDYFDAIYPGYNVFLYFPVPCFIAYVITGVTFNWICTKFTYKTLVTVGIVATNIFVALLLVISVVQGNTTTKFWLSLTCCFFVGFFGNFVQLSFFAMINYFGEATVSRFTIGTAASGILTTLLRIIITAILGTDNPKAATPMIIYLVLAVVFNFVDLFLNLKFYQTDYYKSKIESTVLRKDDTKSLLSDSGHVQQSKSYARLMWETMKEINPYPLFILLNFVITFMLFPSLTLSKKTDLNPVWSTLLFLSMYNLGDFLGKIAGDFRKSFNAVSITYLFLSRLFFFYTIPMMDISKFEDDHLLNNNVYPYVNQFLFGFTNGLVINGSFILSFESAPNEYKKYAGVLGGICLQIGIMIGSFLAIPLQKWVLS